MKHAAKLLPKKEPTKPSCPPCPNQALRGNRKGLFHQPRCQTTRTHTASLGIVRSVVTITFVTSTIRHMHMPPLCTSTPQQFSPNISKFCTTLSSQNQCTLQHDRLGLSWKSILTQMPHFTLTRIAGKSTHASPKAHEKELAATLMAIPCP